MRSAAWLAAMLCAAGFAPTRGAFAARCAVSHAVARPVMCTRPDVRFRSFSRRPQRARAPRAREEADASGDGAEAASRIDTWYPTEGLLSAPPVQAILCAAGYLVHVVFLSRRSLPLGGTRVGLDTLAGLGVIGGVLARRASLGAPALPPWLWRKPRPDDGPPLDASASMADLAADKQADKLTLLATGAAAALFIPIALGNLVAPIADALATIPALALPAGAWTASKAAALNLILCQSVQYAAVIALFGAVHGPFLRGKKWVRFSWRRPWVVPALGGYAASLALFNLVEPINQAPRRRRDLAKIAAEIASRPDCAPTAAPRSTDTRARADAAAAPAAPPPRPRI